LENPIDTKPVFYKNTGVFGSGGCFWDIFFLDFF
jgi:hypothetical protein